MRTLRTIMRAAVALSFPCALACGFSAPGGSAVTVALGDSGSTVDATDADAGSSGVESDPGSGGGTSGGDDTGIDATTTPAIDDSDATGTPTDDGSESSGAPIDPCANPPLYVEAIPVSSATVGSPMSTATHPVHGEYAYSTESNDGTVSFTFNVGCADEFWVWTLVYDDLPGAVPDNPDSFRVRVDGQSEVLFIYGCYNWGLSSWTWETVTKDSPLPCSGDRQSYSLAPGAHTIHVRNNEGGAFGSAADPGAVAAIAAIIVTNDEGYQP